MNYMKLYNEWEAMRISRLSAIHDALDEGSMAALKIGSGTTNRRIREWASEELVRMGIPEWVLKGGSRPPEPDDEEDAPDPSPEEVEWATQRIKSNTRKSIMAMVQSSKK